ncbi:hypothetical protein CEY12_05650 [Chryseobacterium sp. T16E-39]|uniref:DUF1294 domain-containing protein n=1 Tax=Chryseobacterium sp. T16E-39 TaxID=2015076 RepID=UPI000B5B3EF0|nr:DUF1294 domain-containing protein [Chryseobacterium sp. T16E-39]ASK29619.1 hypothetical protein CEY12_05650 [Chryseobacterium sp. T16E-39]
MIYFLLLINVFCFFIFGVDKKRAKKYQRRISENTLLLLTFFGGTIGALSGMFVFRHKILKKSFLLKFGLVVLIQVVLIYFFQKVY